MTPWIFVKVHTGIHQLLLGNRKQTGQLSEEVFNQQECGAKFPQVFSRRYFHMGSLYE
jgi:hypothetical protein